jgi:serine/threonine-protein kinase
LLPSSLDARALRRHLRRFTRAYALHARSLSCDGVRHDDAGLAFGTGGAIYVLSSAPRGERGGADDLLHAGRLLERTHAHARESTSLFHGAAGLHLLAYRLATKRRELAAAEAALRALVRQSGALESSAELVGGAAGLLTALALAHVVAPDPRIATAADLLADALFDQAPAPAHFGFAHGQAGILHALLGWSRAFGRPVPARLVEQLESFGPRLDAAAATGRATAWDAHASWCNGAAGLALLWARAYEVTGERAYLERARRAAWALTGSPSSGAFPDVCCGLGGRAFALLALERIEPEMGWYEHALTATAEAIRRAMTHGTEHPNGLLKGLAGLVCLARDLIVPPRDRIGLPMVEGVARR